MSMQPAGGLVGVVVWGTLLMVPTAAHGHAGHAHHPPVADRPSRDAEPGHAECSLSRVESGYSEELATLDRDLAWQRRRADRWPDSWLTCEALAKLYLERARLSGCFEDYAQAEAWLDRAFRIAGPQAGPFLTRASLEASLHRFDRVGAWLDRAASCLLLSAEERGAIALARSDLYFEVGRYAEAESLLGAEAARRPQSFDVLSRQGHRAWKLGDTARAVACFDRAGAVYRGGRTWPRAWLALHSGLVLRDAGNRTDAARRFAQADHVLSGWWVVEQQLAEMHAAEGRLDCASTIYRDLLARTGHPELMDALAEIAEVRGEAQDARLWRDAARAGFEEQLRDYPEAALGHAFAHFLATDPARALELAHRDVRLRPGAEARRHLSLAAERCGLRAGAHP